MPMRFGVHLTNSGTLLTVGGDEDEMAGWNPELVNRAMELLENIAGIYRVSTSPLRHLGEGPMNTCAGFARSGDGLTHAQFVKQMAEEGNTPSIARLMEVASALGNRDYPDRKNDAQLAQLLLAGVSKTKRAAATKDIAAWLDAEAAEQRLMTLAADEVKPRCSATTHLVSACLRRPLVSGRHRKSVMTAARSPDRALRLGGPMLEHWLVGHHGRPLSDG